MRKDITFFVCYAREDARLAAGLQDRLTQQMKPSKKYAYRLWKDKAILPGENWNKVIHQAIAESRAGLLLISPSFLGSDYIKKVELPKLLKKKDGFVIPVLLRKVNFKFQDARGLDHLQIYRLQRPGWPAPRSYFDCNSNQREAFAAELYEAIEARLAALGI